MSVRAWIPAALVASLVATACGGAQPVESEPGGGAPPATEAPEASSPPEAPEAGGIDRPPPVTLAYPGGSAQLDAWTFCYSNGCADGMPPRNPHDVGSPEEVRVEFAEPGWSFTATFTPAGRRCGREQRVPLEATGDGTFFLRPAGFAGTYDVTLFGRGEGDLFVTFRWTTPSDGPLPEPKARLAILAAHDGGLDSYGVELSVENLARDPRRAGATITVRAQDGEAVTFDATRSRLRCLPEGSVYWDGPDDAGRAAARLGDGPFAYEVELTLDGERYVAEATWPGDVIRGNEPSVRLDFTPELPALPGGQAAARRPAATRP